MKSLLPLLLLAFCQPASAQKGFARDAAPVSVEGSAATGALDAAEQKLLDSKVWAIDQDVLVGLGSVWTSRVHILQRVSGDLGLPKRYLIVSPKAVATSGENFVVFPGGWRSDESRGQASPKGETLPKKKGEVRGIGHFLAATSPAGTVYYNLYKKAPGTVFLKAGEADKAGISLDSVLLLDDALEHSSLGFTAAERKTALANAVKVLGKVTGEYVITGDKKSHLCTTIPGTGTVALWPKIEYPQAD